MSPTPAERERLAARSRLTEKQASAITKQLDRMDAESEEGPWTRRTLQLIARKPGVVTTVLARQLNRQRVMFRARLIELRDLGLIYSLDVGFSLSPCGRAYLKMSPQ